MQTRLLRLVAGLFLFCVINAPATVLYVDLNCSTPTPPYTNWITAATNIQDAVDAANPADTILVTNGVYQTGGRIVYGTMTNRVVVDKAVTVQSVNGPAMTVIQGYRMPTTTNGDSAVRCVYLTNNAALIGFTLTNGATRKSGIDVKETGGGGVWCESSQALVSNCVLVANSASFTHGVGGAAVSGTLVDCTLTNNLAGTGGAAYNSVLSNCVVSGNATVGGSGGGLYLCTATHCAFAVNIAGDAGGAANGSTLTDCTITNNSASSGGGTCGGTLLRCTVSGNTANAKGGGVYYGAANDCLITSNLVVAVSGTGGGAYSVGMTNCTLSGNRASSGGGANLGTLYNCLVSFNSASALGGGAASNSLINCVLANNTALSNGGGACGGTLLNCAIVRNLAFLNGGGVYGGLLTNCTLAGNSGVFGGGADSSTLDNCIVYHNDAISGTNHNASVLAFCCTVPAPESGTGNITAEPQFADQFHLSSDSPCRAAGAGIYATGTDIDGEPWANLPSIGCDQYLPGPTTGALGVVVIAAYTNLATGFVGTFIAQIEGRASANTWDFGDGTIVRNQPYATHSWASAGDYQVVAVAFNDSYPGGVSNAVTVRVVDQPVQYVAQGNTNPVAPYLSWALAATNIQDALDAAVGGGRAVFVSDGVYRVGGKTVAGALTNRVAITRAMTVQSVNGPAATIIEGYQVPGTTNGDSAVRCVYLTNGAVLSGFTLTNGATRASGISDLEMSGGGAWCLSTNAVLSNCVVIANSCFWWGAGVYSGTLLDCAVNANANLNACLGGGGGAAFSQLFNCRLSGNRTGPGDGGGALSCYLTNCVLTGNFDVGANKCTLDNCLVTANNGTGVSGGVANNCTISSNAPAVGGIPNGGGAVGANLSNCVLYANQAGNGGGVYNCTLSFCTLSNNWAARCGGGIYLDAILSSTFSDSSLSGNTAGDSGGGFYCLSATSALALNRCTFSGNTATNNGGGMAFAGSSSGKVTSCTLSNNQAGANGGGLYFATTMTYGSISNCSFWGNSASNSGGAAYYANLTNCSIVGNQAGKGGGALGGSLTACILSTNSARLGGGGAWNANLQSCLLVGNRAGDGGGVYNANLTACTLLNNAAVTNGGGANTSALRNSLFTGNAASSGGGAYSCTLYNCTVVGNTATNSGGGLSKGSIINSIVYYNTAPTSSNYSGGSFTACCAMPGPVGSGIITNAPVFVDLAGGNFRLQTNSPCINSGDNSYAAGFDLDGRSRIVGGKVDMGAYEFRGAGTGEFAAWLQQYGLALDGSADFRDSDSDGLNNWQEWIAGTTPTNASSVLKLSLPTGDGPGLTVGWQSIGGKSYYLDRSTSLASTNCFLSIQSNIVGQAGMTIYTDASATNGGPYFYRVGVQ